MAKSRKNTLEANKEKYPKLYREFSDNNDFTPSDLTLASSKKVLWKFDCSHEHERSIRSRLRTKNDTGCQICANRILLKGFNDLSTTHPEIASQWDADKNEESPDSVIAGSNKKVWWKCEKGHSWETTPNHRTCHGTDCPGCAGRQLIKGKNDLASQKPGLLKEWDFAKNKVKPHELMTNTKKQVWWKCEKGHSWSARVAHRANYNTGCPICSNKEVLAGYNDLASRKPELLKDWDYSKNKRSPDSVVFVSTSKAWWKCDKGHSWQAPIRNRSLKKSGCHICCNNVLKKGYNDFETHNPELLKEWDYDKNKHPSEYINKSRDRVWWKCDKGHSWATTIVNKVCNKTGCPRCSKGGSSQGERQVAQVIRQLDPNIVTNTRKVLDNLELDIYSEKHKIAVEFNGLFWHSELYKDKEYHRSKTEECLKNDIRLIHIWEDDWRDKPEIIKSMLHHAFGKTSNRIYARKCQIREIDLTQRRPFFDQNHLNGNVGASLSFGLFFKDELVSAISFRKPMHYRDSIEIARFATKLNHVVVGGFSRLLKHSEKHFGKKNKYKEIVTYIDLDHGYFKGNVYSQNGFTYVKDTPLDYCYTDGIMREHRMKYKANNDMSESEVAESCNVFRLYGVGNKLYKKTI